MGSNVTVMNESTNEMTYEINHVLNCGYEIKCRGIARLRFQTPLKSLIFQASLRNC